MIGYTSQRPMLATPNQGASGRGRVEPEELFRRGWVADLKVDGIRAFLVVENGAAELWSRSGGRLTRQFPELVDHPVWRGCRDLWLDGEIVTVDGLFQSVNTRSKQNSPTSISRYAGQVPAVFMAFDLPGLQNEVWAARRTKLESLVAGLGDGKHFQVTPVGVDMGFVDSVRRAGLEGVIFKEPSGLYRFGTRSPTWLKEKNVSVVSCVVASYEYGQGSRSEFGAMNLSVFDDSGGLVDVGRCGTGFNNAQIVELKAALDAGRVLVVDIECLNRTGGDQPQLRFPVFRGVRDDVAVEDCTFDQVLALRQC